PDRLIQVGLNYRSHLDEIGIPAPEKMIYAVAPVVNEIAASGATITFPAEEPDQVDHECEIALVIGTAAQGIDPDDAWSISAGITLVPGDVVMTGSPAGVGAFSGRFLQSGDVVEITVADLPPLRNDFQAA